MFRATLLLTSLSFALAKKASVPGHPSTPDNVTSRLQVDIPSSLARKEGYDHREALFGTPPYGGTISQKVYYTDSELCSDVDPRSGYPERDNDETGDMAPWEPPFILMVDRGGCSFVQKARNAQHAGAAAIIIADNNCLCNDEKCMESAGIGNDECERGEPIMADDGSGGDIFIPSFLMFKMDANKVMDEVKQNTMVQMTMSWALPSPDDTVEYELWTVPTDTVSLPFQDSWKDIALKLDSHSRFTPHQYIIDGTKASCHGFDGRNHCFNLCTNNGRYCAADPDNNIEKGLSGADVVRESLRRLCVWKFYGEDGIGEKYWDYVQEFNRECNSEHFFTNKSCTDSALKYAKIKVDQIDQCIDTSGGTEENEPNNLLEGEITAREKSGIVFLPTVFVNNVALRGALSASSVFTAICAGFLVGTEPDVCLNCSGCRNIDSCAKSGVCTTDASSGGGGTVSKRTFGLSLLFVCGIFGAAGYLHWRKTRDEMRDQVRNILAEYMPLEDKEEGGQENSPMDFARRGGTASLIS